MTQYKSNNSNNNREPPTPPIMISEAELTGKRIIRFINKTDL
jgi:hypothetical protein